MNKTDLIAIAAQHAGMTKKDTERVLNAAIDAMTAALDQRITELEGYVEEGYSAFDLCDGDLTDKVEIKSQTRIAYNTRAHYSTRYHEQEDHGFTHGSRFHPAHSDCINFV